MNYSKINIKNFIFKSLKLVMWLLLIFGDSFTKINIVGTLYLYDFILIILFLLSIINFSIPKKDIFFLVFIIIALLYLLISFYTGDKLIYTIRQFMIVGYFIFTYFIFQKIKSKSDELLVFIFKLSKVSIFLQLGYFIIVLIKGNSLFDDFNYLSPFSVMLLPIYCSKVLIFEKDDFKKIAKVFLVLVISTMVGHSSAFLSVFSTILLYFMLMSNIKFILISSVITIVLILSLYIFLPQFQDANANWRMYYWGVAIKNTMENYFLGNGFGKSFITDLQIQEMVSIFGDDNDLLDSEGERYYKAFHNSFVTLFFHLGIFILFLYKPFYLVIKNILSSSRIPQINALALSFLGVTIWCFFNVILELPHSSILFWLIFFLASFKFNDKSIVYE